MSEPSATELEQAIWKCTQGQQFEEALALCDDLITRADAPARALNNALWLISDDNTHLGIQPERARRYLSAAQPHGPKNPAIFYTGACLLIELGDVEQCLAWIALAVKHRIPELEALENEPMFDPIRGSEAFQAIFRVQPLDCLELLELAADLSENDKATTAAMEKALAKPPRTTEEIGFYVGRRNNDFENCFRYMVTLISRLDGVLHYVEDKYAYQILEDFDDAVGLPDSVRAIFPKGRAPEQDEFDRGYLGAMKDLEQAYKDTGRVLLSIWLAGGDTIYFAPVKPEVAERWANRPLGKTHDGQYLGLREPAWDVFYQLMAYAFMWEDEEPPEGTSPPDWRTS